MPLRMDFPMTTFVQSRRRFGFCLLALLASGCGYEEYNRRLGETAQYFAYQEKMNTNLAVPTRELPIEEIRLPIQFSPLPKPKPPAKSADSTVSEEVPFDPRQPNFINATLPGLVAAWQAPVDTLVDGKSAVRPGYIFAVSNYWMFTTGQAELAPLFTRDIRRLAAANFIDPRNPVQKDPDGMGDRESFPRAAKYTPPVPYDVTRFNPEQPINDVRYTVELFSHRSGDIQVVLIVVLPRDADVQRAKLNERIPLMLETLKVSNKKPVAPPKKVGGAAAAPAQPAAGF